MHFARTQMPNVTHIQVDLDDTTFWSGLMSKLHAEGQPPPDIMHASPPCAAHSKLANLRARECLKRVWLKRLSSASLITRRLALRGLM
eukprot:992856-Pleurochrysis_carterae.AAC.1